MLGLYKQTPKGTNIKQMHGKKTGSVKQNMLLKRKESIMRVSVINVVIEAINIHKTNSRKY